MNQQVFNTNLWITFSDSDNSVRTVTTVLYPCCVSACLYTHQ